MIKISRSTLSLLFLSIICISLQLGRTELRGDLHYRYLLWNLFLAWIPLIFALFARRLYLGKANKLLIISNLLGWLLFFPNAPYIITDLLHLQDYAHHIIWFDSLLIFIFAMTGFLVGIYSLQVVHQILENIYGKIWAWFQILVSIVLSGFGVYLGRYSRWNSWDLFYHPYRLFRDSFHQLQNPVALELTIAFSIVLLGFYVAFRNLSQNQGYEYAKNDAKF